MKTSEAHFNDNYAACDIVQVPLAISVPSKRIRRGLESHMSRAKHLADFGCGHGVGLWVMKGLAPQGARFTGLDFSEVAIAKAKQYVGGPQVSLVVADFCQTTSRLLPKAVDFLYSNQVIEHLPDPEAFLKSCHRCLKHGGGLYIGTVYKKPWAWYFYHNPQGQTVLEPTHVREYTAVDELLKPMADAGFAVTKHALSPVVYPLVDPFLKILSRFWKGPRAFGFLNAPWLMALRRFLVIPVPGYYLFQVLAIKAIPPKPPQAPKTRATKSTKKSALQKTKTAPKQKPKTNERRQNKTK